MHHIISFLIRIAYAAVFGFILLWHTGDIIKYIPQLLGGLLLFECIAQLLELLVLKTRTKVHGGFFIIPSAVLLYGLFLIFCCNLPLDLNLNDFASSLGTMVALKIELKIGGACFIAFVISELLISACFMKPLYRPKQFAEEKRQAEEARIAAEKAQQELAVKAAQAQAQAEPAKSAEPAVPTNSPTQA